MIKCTEEERRSPHGNSNDSDRRPASTAPIPMTLVQNPPFIGIQQSLDGIAILLAARLNLHCATASSLNMLAVLGWDARYTDAGTK